jgi:outer membrane protein assembly factor BamB
MSLRPALERERDRYRLPPDAFDRLLDERSRRRRRERTVTVIVSILLAGAAVAGAMMIFGAGRNEPMRQTPSPITPDNIGSLHVAWRAALPQRAGTLVVAGSSAFVVTDLDGLAKALDQQILAFPLACTQTAGCDPSWTGNVGRSPRSFEPEGPVVADDTLFSGGSDLFAFPINCRADAGRCQPSWIGVVPGAATQPLVDGSHVYVGTSKGAVFAFPLRCDHEDTRTCDPVWSSPPAGVPLVVSAVADGRLFASVVPDAKRPELNRLYAFGTSCTGACRPTQVADVAGQKFASMPTLGGDVLYVGASVDGGDGALIAFDAACGIEPACRLWTVHENEALNLPRPIVANGVVVTAARYGTNAVRGFPVGQDVSRPLWSSCCTLEIVDNTPVAADGVVYVSSRLEGVSAYRLACTNRNGFCRPLWSWAAADDPGVVTAAVGDGTLVVATQAGGLVALRPAIHPSAGLSAAEQRATAVFYLGIAVVSAVVVAMRRRRRIRLT